MDIASFDQILSARAGVVRLEMNGRARWQFRGRLVAREMSATVIEMRLLASDQELLVADYPEICTVVESTPWLTAVDLDTDSVLLYEVVTQATHSAWLLARSESPRADQ